MVHKLLLFVLGSILCLALALFYFRRSTLAKKFYPYFLFGVFCLIFTLGLLIYHHIPRNYPDVAINFTIYGHFDAVINYDSPEFMKDAIHPTELLEKTALRQSRPGLILLVAGLYKLVSPFSSWIMPVFRATGTEIERDYYIPYALYVLTNFLFLLLSFFLFLKILARETHPIAFSVIYLSGLFVFNDVMKAFLLTPHTQIFNLLSPLVCLYAYREVTHHKLFESGRIFLLSFLVGMGVTAYATFLLFIPSVIIAIGWNALRENRKIDRQMILMLVVMILLTILPFLVWVIYVYILTGSFYSSEVAMYQTFVWIIPMFKSAPVQAILTVVKIFGSLAKSTAEQSLALLFILVAVLAVVVDRDHPLSFQINRIKRFPLSSLVVSLLFLFFFAVGGIATYRYAFSAVPPLIVGTAVVVNSMLSDAGPIRRRLASGVVILLVSLECLVLLSKLEPFS